MLADRGSRLTGLISMAAYLAFWAGAVVLAKRELDARFPKVVGAPQGRDHAMVVLRERYARGEIDAEAYRAMEQVLGTAGDSAP